MKVGDLVRNKNSKNDELGIFLGMRTFKNHTSEMTKEDTEKDYICPEVYWSKRAGKNRVRTIQLNLIEVLSE